MHKARSFPRSPAENSQYFHTPFRGKLRQSMAPLNRILLQSQNCFNPLPAPLRRPARIKRYPYPQASMVTRRVTSALNEKQFKQGCDNEAALGLNCTHSHPKIILSSYFPTADPHGRPSKNSTNSSIRKIPKRKKWKHAKYFDPDPKNYNCYLYADRDMTTRPLSVRPGLSFRPMSNCFSLSLDITETVKQQMYVIQCAPFARAHACAALHNANANDLLYLPVSVQFTSFRCACSLHLHAWKRLNG